MANEDLKTFEKSGNLPKLTPVLFNKRKESDILETHRGNYKRHWETSSRLEFISNLISNCCPGSLKLGGGSIDGLRVKTFFHFDVGFQNNDFMLHAKVDQGFKDSPDSTHFISEINDGKSRIRHRSTLELNF